MSGIFYGVGLGPGDPELVTVKALKILKQVDRIFAPASRDSRSLAGEIINYHLPASPIEYLEFPMIEDRIRLELAWDDAAAKVGPCLDKMDVAFVTLGDPLLYGSYLYLYQRIRDNYPLVEIVTIPGLPGFCAAAARSNFYLTKDNDRLLLLTGRTEPAEFQEYCRNHETIVVYKPRNNFQELVHSFLEICPDGSGTIIKRCGMAGEKIIDLREFNQSEADYFTIAIFHPNRHEK